MATYFTQMKTGAWQFGHDWVANLIAGINNRLEDLEELLAYIRGLFPSSPAEFGAWQQLPDGFGIGQGFGADLAAGVSAAGSMVSGALGQLRGEFAFAPAGGGAAGGAAGGGYAPGGSAYNITITGNTFANRSDVDYLLDELERRLALRGALRP